MDKIKGAGEQERQTALHAFIYMKKKQKTKKAKKKINNFKQIKLVPS